MNLSRKHKKHLNTHLNFQYLNNKEFPCDWSTYILAERMARDRKPHRRFRKVIKKGGVL